MPCSILVNVTLGFWQNISTEYRLVCSHWTFESLGKANVGLTRLRMLCARVINGIGTGFLNVIVPVWSAEVRFDTFTFDFKLPTISRPGFYEYLVLPMTYYAVLVIQDTDPLFINLPASTSRSPAIRREVSTVRLEALEKSNVNAVLIGRGLQCV